MTRFYLLFAVALLGVVALFTLKPSRASDDEKPVSALQTVETSEVAELVERIAVLEKRLAALEGREPLIRIADRREEPQYGGVVEPHSPVPVPTQESPQFQEVVEPHDPVPVPTIDYADDEVRGQKTNGQNWRFRLLNLRRVISDPPIEKPDQSTGPSAKRLKVRTASLIGRI